MGYSGDTEFIKEEKMKKKISMLVAIVLALAMVAGLAACGDSGSGDSPSPPPAGNDSPPPQDNTSPDPSPPEEPQHTQGWDTVPDAATIDDSLPGYDGPPDPDNLPNLHFTFAHQYPASHHHNTDVIIPYIEALMDAIPRLNIELVPGGVISTNNSVHDDIRYGMVDMMWATHGGAPGRYPLTEILEFPNLFSSAVEATRVIEHMMETYPPFASEFSHMKLFNIYTTEPGDIYTTKDIRVPADLAGQRIRSPGPSGERSLTAAGAVTISLGMGDVYDAVGGIIDGLATSPSAITTYNLWEVVGYATNGMGLYVTPFFMGFSNAAWDMLTPREQFIAMNVEIGGEAFNIHSAKMYDDLGVLGIENMRNFGMTVNDLTPDEQAQWLEAMSPVIEAYLVSLDERNIPGREFYDLVLAYRDSIR